MTNIETIAALPEVATVSAWKDRHYVNLAHTSRNHNGDRNTKIWIKGNVMTVEIGKGYRSDGAIADLRALDVAVRELGMKVVGY